MESRNDYYDQKRAGLGYTDEPFEAFLESPRARDLGSALEARERWLPQLARAWEGDAQPRGHERRSEVAASPRAWFPKRSAPALRAALHAKVRESDERTREAALARVAAEEQLAAANGQLASLNGQLVSSRALVEELDSRLHTSERARDRMTWELEASRAGHTQAQAQVAALDTALTEANRAREAQRLELDETGRRLAETGRQLAEVETALAVLREDSTRIQDALRHEGELLRASVRDLSNRLAITRARLEMLQTLCERTKSRLTRIIA
jgi:chromosome segregation ATPase